MRRISGHGIGVAQGELVLFSDFQDGGVMWTGTGARDLRRAVRFSAPFREAPMVHVALTMWDLDRHSNARMDIQAEAVSAEGFEIVFRTWGDSRIARVRAGWLAIGPCLGEDDWEID